MSTTTKQSHKQLLFYFFACLLIFSILYSRFLASASMFALFFLSFLQTDQNKESSIAWNQNYWSQLRASFQNISLLPFYGIFLITILSYFISDDVQSWLIFVRLKLPYLALPLIFVNFNKISRRGYDNLFYFLVQVCFISSVFVLVRYFSSFEKITETIGAGHAIPTPIIHTKYSLIIAISILSGIILWMKSHYIFSKKERYLLGFQIIFLFFFLHILAVRSGLAALYVTGFCLGLIYFIQQKRYLHLIILLLIIVAMPLLAYRFVPSFYKKVHYTLYDLKMNQQGMGAGYNDSMRLRSWMTGLTLFKENPILGVGFGDLEAKNQEVYYRLYTMEVTGMERPRLPHNQFIFYAAASGIAGLLIFICSFFIPILYRKNTQEPLFLSFTMCVFILCLVEKPLERSDFIAFYLFFTLLSMSYLGSWKFPDYKTMPPAWTSQK